MLSRFCGFLHVVLGLCLLLGSPGLSHAQLAVGGVYIDPEGLLRSSREVPAAEISKVLKSEALESPDSSTFATAAPLRKVSLRRLETAVAARHAAGKPLSAEMQYLGGLQSVKHVFVDQETGDIILAGPAEGWTALPTGEVVGVRSAHPVLHLDDLLVCLRFALATTPGDGFIGCSIEPTNAGLQSYAQFVNTLGGIDRSRVPEIMRGMERAMGPQDVKLYGAPPTSRAALVMVAADYRLKRIAMGHDPSPSKKVVSYLDLLSKSTAGAKVPQHRWWFVGGFDKVQHAADELGWTIDGQGVTVATAPTSATVTNKPSRSATVFAENFTRNFNEIAGKVPVFLELKNLVNLATVAAIVARAHNAAVEAETKGYRPEQFLDSTACPLAAWSAPRQVPSLSNLRLVRDRHWIFSVSGGVELQVAGLLDPEKLTVADTALSTLRTQSMAAGVERWWWD